MTTKHPLQTLTLFDQIRIIANGMREQAKEDHHDATTLRLIAEQHRKGLCSIEDALARAYGLGRERGTR